MLIVINAVVSFRSVPRIFHQFRLFAPNLDFKVPCYNSVINWAIRFGHHLLSHVGKLGEDWFAVVDMSIETGLGKALVVLRVPFSTWASKGSEALTLTDCEAIGVDVRTVWNGESVQESLKATFESAGLPAFIIRDQGSDIAAGVKLLGIPSVHDIGHETANALKSRFSKEAWFADFISLTASFGTKLRQSRWSFMSPPKIRSKGRFQSISRVAEWAEMMLAFFDAGNIETSVEPLLSKLKAFREPILRLLKLCSIANKIQTVLKASGLSPDSAALVREVLATQSINCPVRRRLEAWLDRHMALLRDLRLKHANLSALPVSSDIIESLFGRLKHGVHVFGVLIPSAFATASAQLDNLRTAILAWSVNQAG